MTTHKKHQRQAHRRRYLLGLLGIGSLGLIVGYLCTFYINIVPPSPISINEKLTVCFTPHGQCQSIIIRAIDQARFSIKMQTYSFTSKEIANALLQAHQRGIDIQILSDRSQLTAKHSQIPDLISRNISVLIDRVPGIAHNKIIIIDDYIVLTGSYNWTNAAEYRNAENLLRIEDPAVAAYYLENWNKRLQKAQLKEREQVG